MKTTTLVVELLLYGTQASIWAVLLLGAIWGEAFVVAALQVAADASIPHMFFGVALIYSLGAVMDRISDGIAHVLRKKTFMRCSNVADLAKNQLGTNRVRRELELKTLSSYVVYIGHRHRIVRGTVVNAALIFVAGVIYLVLNVLDASAATWINWLLTAALFVVVLVIGGWLSYIVLDTTESERLDQLDKVIEDRTSGSI